MGSAVKNESLTKSKLSAEKIFHLFFKYNIKYLPIIRDNNIQGYISKEKTMRQANNESFFKVPIEINLKHIFQNIKNLSFFEEVDSLQLMKIPYLDADAFEIKVYKISEFNTIYRPVEILANGDFLTVLDKYSLPVIIINSHFNIIYTNDNLDRLTKKLSTKTGKRSRSMTDFIPVEFWEQLEDELEKNVSSVTIAGAVFKVNVSRVELKKGSVWVLTFIG